MNIKKKFESIDQSQLSESQKGILAKIEEATKGFTITDEKSIEKVDTALDNIISKLEKTNPQAIKGEVKEVKPKREVTKKPAKSTTKTPKEPKKEAKGKRNIFSIAKEIRKADESWDEAKNRAKKIMEDEKKDTTKKMKTETDKLLAFIKRRKELDGLSGTSIKKDSKIEALPKGRRVSKKGWKNQHGESEGGKVYYENRDNRTDRLAPNFEDKIYLAEGGTIIGTPETPLGRDLGIDYTGLVGETGAMSSGEMFADGGGVYAKGGELKGKFLAEIKVPYNYERVVKDEFEFTEFLSKALTKKWFGNGVWGVKVVKQLFVENYEQKIIVEIEIPVGVTQGGGLDKFDVAEFMSKTLTKKWFGNGVWDVKIVNKYEQGGSLVDGYLTDPNFGDFQAGVYVDGGGVGKSLSKFRVGESFRYKDNGTIVYRVTKVYNDGACEARDEEGDNYTFEADELSQLEEAKYELGGSTGLPAGTEQHFVNYYLGEGTAQGIYAEGGGIENQYIGKTPSEIWSMYSISQKYHFLLDHSKEIESTPMSVEKATKTAYKFLPEKIKKSFQKHIREGQYAMGGSLGNHGLKHGDQIIKTLSGGVQKIKTKDGQTMYVDLSNGYRGAEPPLPFAKGGRLKSALARDRKYFNESESWERQYSKNKPSRKGYKFDDGGFMTDPNFGDFQTVVYAKRGALLSAKERYILELKGLTGLTKEGVEKYISDNGLTEDEVLNIVIGLGRKQIQRMDVVTAMTGKKNNAESKRLIRFAKSDKALKLADGGQLEIKFAGGGKLETKIQKKVDEVNSLIEKAIDKDGDPIMVVDKSGTWEEPMQYKPIVYKNGRLYLSTLSLILEKQKKMLKQI
jgi:hypothetical protein